MVLGAIEFEGHVKATSSIALRFQKFQRLLFWFLRSWLTLTPRHPKITSFYILIFSSTGPIIRKLCCSLLFSTALLESNCFYKITFFSTTNNLQKYFKWILLFNWMTLTSSLVKSKFRLNGCGNRMQRFSHRCFYKLVWIKKNEIWVVKCY